MSEELVNVPQDLRLVSDEELPQLEAQAVAEFDRLNAEDDVTPENLERLTNLQSGIKRVRAELSVRDARAKKEAEDQRARLLAERQQLQAQVHGTPAEDGAIVASADGSIDAEAIAAAAARGTATALVAALGEQGAGRDLTELSKRVSASLADANRFAPKVKVPAPELAVTAAVDIPGLARGTELNNISALAEAMHRRARSMTIARGDGPRQLVASVRNEYEHTIDDRTKPSQVEELFRYLTSDDKKEALLAAGGWCAPSEIRYDFFNIACEDGLIDLPTFGVSRGGVQFPISPSLGDADFYGTFDNAGNPWLWTEADDEAATAGTPTKPCIRVPCPSFDEERLECYGVCVTAGNLTDDAYPEATQNFIRLMMTMHSKEINRRIISLMSTASTAVTGGGFETASTPAFNQIYSGVELAAIDYREKYGMCETDVLEVVLPRWIVGVIRADLARRTGVEATLSVTRQQLLRYFADRGIRVQLVADWQTRGAGQFGAQTGTVSDWPTTVDFMIYAAGTFLLGNGLTLDLGVVRDSTLNETNDHTAAWTEECKLLAKVGHESRQYTVDFDVVGDPARGTATGGL